MERKIANIFRSKPNFSKHKIIDITRPAHRCAVSASCPAVLRREDTPTYIIVGKTCDPNEPGIQGRVGPDETAIEISAEILEAALQHAIIRALNFPVTLILSVAQKFRRP